MHLKADYKAAMEAGKLLCILAAVTLAVPALGGCGKPEEADITPVPEQTAKTEDNETEDGSVRAALKTWEVYRLDDLDFVFVLACLHIETQPGTVITLDHFVTSEGVSLSDTGAYVTALEDHAYYVGRRNVMFSLVSAQSAYDAFVFMPVKDSSAKEITLACDLDGVDDMHIDLSRNIVTDGSSLYYEASEVIADTDMYHISLFRALDITDEMFLIETGGEQMQYTIPAADKVYAFEISVRAKDDQPVVITDAVFIPDGYVTGYHAMAEGIRSMKETNIIGRRISGKDTGFLFFEVYGPEYNPVSYSGLLQLVLGETGQILNVNVNLN